MFNLQAKEARELVKNEQKNGEESADRKGKGSSSWLGVRVKSFEFRVYVEQAVGPWVAHNWQLRPITIVTGVCNWPCCAMHCACVQWIWLNSHDHPRKEIIGPEKHM